MCVRYSILTRLYSNAVAVERGRNGRESSDCAVISTCRGGMDSPKRVLVHLEGLDTSKLPAAVLSAAGIRKDGIVAVDVPRFPRVSDVKMALARLLRIPAPDQVGRLPTPNH
jgi:hypothetical protein